MYEEKEAIAAGGEILPKWTSKRPKFLPEEYYWLIGATHKGFPEKVTEVRYTQIFMRIGCLWMRLNSL